MGAGGGGIIAAQLLHSNNWRAVFYFGASVTAILIPVVYFVTPECVHWLTRKQPSGALEKINRALQRMAHTTAGALPPISADVQKRSVSDIFTPVLLPGTVIVTCVIPALKG